MNNSGNSCSRLLRHSFKTKQDCYSQRHAPILASMLLQLSQLDVNYLYPSFPPPPPPPPIPLQSVSNRWLPLVTANGSGINWILLEIGTFFTRDPV